MPVIQTGGTVIRADVLSSCPIYLFGLVRVLRDAGITVLKTRTSPDDGTPSILADAVVIDADVLEPQADLAPITEIVAHTPVLVVNHTCAESPDPLLSAGAAAVISKNETSEQIVGAVRSVATGAPVLVTEPLVEPAVPVPPVLCRPAGPSLSEREGQVLRYIARGLTHGQIATRIGISPHTVDTYVKRIRVKLGAGNKAELTRLALLGGHGAPTPRLPPLGEALPAV